MNLDTDNLGKSDKTVKAPADMVGALIKFEQILSELEKKFPTPAALMKSQEAAMLLPLLTSSMLHIVVALANKMQGEERAIALAAYTEAVNKAKGDQKNAGM